MKTNRIIQGDALEVLKTLPDESINCVMTSPPYWALRDYGVEGQLGLEPTFDEYIKKLCDIFEETKRVLRKDGTCWVNIGDTYYGSGAGTQYKPKTENAKEVYTMPYDSHKNTQRNKDSNYQAKCLVGIPFRFALEMINRGWILRNTIIWHKPNCMPSSVKDRFTVDFEYLFFFVKNKKYWFETQYEPLQKESIKRSKRAWSGKDKNTLYNPMGAIKHEEKPNGIENTRMYNVEKGRNKRTVWRISPKPFKESHFAVFPEELCETPIKSGCPEFVCNKCGKPREKILEHNKLSEEGKNYLETIKTPYSIQGRKGYVKVRKLPDLKEFSKYINKNRNKTIEEIEKYFKSQAPHHWFSGESYPSVEDYLKLKEYLGLDNTYEEVMTKEYFKPAEKQSVDYKEIRLSNCNCNAGFSGGIVLDPFFGAGTTGLVALKQNKQFIGIELNKEYIKIAKKRLKPFLEQKRL